MGPALRKDTTASPDGAAQAFVVSVEVVEVVCASSSLAVDATDARRHPSAPPPLGVEGVEERAVASGVVRSPPPLGHTTKSATSIRAADELDTKSIQCTHEFKFVYNYH